MKKISRLLTQHLILLFFSYFIKGGTNKFSSTELNTNTQTVILFWIASAANKTYHIKSKYQLQLPQVQHNMRPTAGAPDCASCHDGLCVAQSVGYYFFFVDFLFWSTFF